MNKCKVGAIIVTYNFDDRLKKSINTLYNQVDYIAIVDNNSNDRCVNYIDELSKLENIRVIYNKENYGIAKAINQGIYLLLQLDCNWIMTLDDDSVLERDCVGKMLKIACNKKSNRIGAICPNIYDINIKEYMYPLSCGYTNINKSIQSGALFNSIVFNVVGLFNESLFIYYVDEDFFERLMLYKYEILRVNNAVINHSDGCLTKKKILWKKFDFNKRPCYAIYYRSRNCIYMIKNYGIKYCKDLLRDPIKIILYDNEKCRKLQYFIKGMINGLFGKYGKIIESKKN